MRSGERGVGVRALSSGEGGVHGRCVVVYYFEGGACGRRGARGQYMNELDENVEYQNPRSL